MKNPKTYIYGLFSLKNGACLYIGRTSKLKERAAAHKTNDTTNGVEFEMRILATTHPYMAGAKEVELIRKHKNLGHAVLNRTPFGAACKRSGASSKRLANTALRRRVGEMKLGDEFFVDSKPKKRVAWNCGRELRAAGKTNFVVETRLKENGTYSIRAVEP